MAKKTTCELYGYGCTETGNYQPYIPPIKLGKIWIAPFEQNGYLVPGKWLDLGWTEASGIPPVDGYVQPFNIDLRFNAPVVKRLEQQVKEDANVDYTGEYDPQRDSYSRVASAEQWYSLYPGSKTRLQFVQEQLERINKIGANILTEFNRLAAEAGTSNTALLQQAGGVAALAGSALAGTPVGIGLLIAGALAPIVAGLIDLVKAKKLKPRLDGLKFELDQLAGFYKKYMAEYESLSKTSTASSGGAILLAAGFVALLTIAK